MASAKFNCANKKGRNHQMIKAASAFTMEIDDVDAACRQLKMQINEKLSFMRNTVGIVQCDQEFVDAGIIEVLHKELGIPLVGGTTAASATNDSVGSFQFSIMVLTSDDVEFAVSHTQGLRAGCFGAVEKSFKDSLAKQSGKPLKLALVFSPAVKEIAGDSFVEAIENVCGKVPVFGTLFVNDALPDFDCGSSLCNGETFTDEMSYLLLFGKTSPRFLVATVPRQSNLTDVRAVITRASGNVAYEINNMRAIDYYESIGLAANGQLNKGAGFVPLLMTLPDAADNIPFVRALTRVEPDGAVMFSGKMFEGAEFSCGSNFGTDVLSSTTDVISQVSGEKNANAALLFSCLIRQLVIGSNPTRELALIKDELKADMPFMASYGAGEISPTSVDSENNAQNRFHNYSLIVCLL
jgi:hypothetical protein